MTSKSPRPRRDPFRPQLWEGIRGPVYLVEREEREPPVRVEYSILLLRLTTDELVHSESQYRAKRLNFAGAEHSPPKQKSCTRTTSQTSSHKQSSGCPSLPPLSNSSPVEAAGKMQHLGRLDLTTPNRILQHPHPNPNLVPLSVTTQDSPAQKEKSTTHDMQYLNSPPSGHD